MAVTLPFVMFLLDYWPLARGASGKPGLPILEKIPLLVMSAASCAVTVIAQHRGGALVRTVVELPLLSRGGNSVIAYELYLREMFWPAGLSVFYPQAYDSLPSWEIVGAALLLLVLSTMVWKFRKRFPWTVTGWLWYLGTLVPVIGLIKVGEQFIADRYTYLPFVGLFLILSWGVAEGVRGRRHASAILAFAALAIIGCLGYVTHNQVGYWKNDETLNRHAIEVTRGNWLAKHNLASILAGQGRIEEAVALYRGSIRDNSLSAGTHNDLAVVLGKQGRFDEAYDHLRTALQLNPGYAEACNNLGLLLSMRNRLEEAEKYFVMAIRLKPVYPDAYYNLGLNDLKRGRFGEAATHFREALRWNPGDRDILEGLQEAISRQGR